jgi:hypothetical protein
LADLAAAPRTAFPGAFRSRRACSVKIWFSSFMNFLTWLTIGGSSR